MPENCIASGILKFGEFNIKNRNTISCHVRQHPTYQHYSINIELMRTDDYIHEMSNNNGSMTYNHNIK